MVCDDDVEIGSPDKERTGGGIAVSGTRVGDGEKHPLLWGGLFERLGDRLGNPVKIGVIEQRNRVRSVEPPDHGPTPPAHADGAEQAHDVLRRQVNGMCIHRRL